jgi:hypothetical protein
MARKVGEHMNITPLQDKAARSGQEFFAPDNIYTSENLPGGSAKAQKWEDLVMRFGYAMNLGT